PEDNTPRLVLADWLEENGDPDRAEFIRLQCNRKSKDWSRRELDLFQTNRLRWLGPLIGDRLIVDRGFFHCEVSAPYFQHLKEPQLQEIAPWIEHISLTMQE